MADFNPYSPPLASQFADNHRTLELHFRVDSLALVDAAAEARQKVTNAKSRTFLLWMIVPAVLMILGFVIAIGTGLPIGGLAVGAMFSAIGLVAIVGYRLFLNEHEWASHVQTSSAEIANLQARYPFLQGGEWCLLIEEHRLLLQHQGHKLAWPMTNIRLEEISTDRGNLAGALFIRTPDLLIPVPRSALSADSLADVAQILRLRVERYAIQAP